MVWSGILNLIQIGEIFSNSTQEALLASEMALQIVGLGILVPIGEELIFRGLIYNRMKQMLSVKAGARDFEQWIGAFCNRKYHSDFSKEMARSVQVYLDDY